MREASIADAGDKVDQVNCSSEVKTLGRRGGERGGGYHLKNHPKKWRKGFISWISKGLATTSFPLLLPRRKKTETLSYKGVWN